MSVFKVRNPIATPKVILQPQSVGGPVAVEFTDGAMFGVLSGDVAVDPASINAGARGATTITVTGAQVGDMVTCEPPASLTAGLVYGGCAVTAADTVTIYLTNVTASPVDGAELTWRYRLIRIAQGAVAHPAAVTGSTTIEAPAHLTLE